MNLRYLFGPPYLAVSNLMACHAFRTVMLCDIYDADEGTIEMTTLHREGVDPNFVSLSVSNHCKLGSRIVIHRWTLSSRMSTRRLPPILCSFRGAVFRSFIPMDLRLGLCPCVVYLLCII